MCVRRAGSVPGHKAHVTIVALRHQREDDWFA